MSTVTGQHVQKHVMAVYKQGIVQLRFQRSLEVKHAKEVLRNKGYATRSLVLQVSENPGFLFIE